MKLTINEKIGQLFIVGIKEKGDIEKVINLITSFHIGGVILYKTAYDNYIEMIELINKLKTANKDNKLPLFISIDQENGRVNRFPKDINIIRNAESIGKCNNNTIINSARLTAKLLSDSGINMNFAPTLDLNRYKNNKVIGNRSYGRDPEKVSSIGNIIINENINNNILSVIKHFPGHGIVKTDTHIFLPIINKSSYKIVMQEDIIPFKNNIKDKCEAIMVGHFLVPSIAGLTPTSLSKNFVDNEIRKKYNFEGLIITDSLSMGSVRYRWGKTGTAIKAINVGMDILTVKYYNGIEKTLYKINDLVNNNYIDEKSINKSIKRIAFIKKKYNINDKQITGISNLDSINNEINALNQEIENQIDKM